MTALNRTRWFLVLACVLVGACGGGDSSSPAGNTSSSQSQALKLPHVASPVAECLGISSSPGGSSSQGIEGTGRRSIKGVVSAVGITSLTVDAIVFDASHAVVFVNGVCATLADVYVGATATVDGQVDDAAHTGTAFAIYADETVIGQITSIDAVAGTLNVNGQAIVATSATVFSDDIQPAELNTLTQSDMIAVSGSLRQDGTLVATHIHRWPTAAYDSVAGVVTSIDATNGLFQIGGVKVLYTYSVLVGFSDGTIHIGDYVRALGPPLNIVAGYESATGVDASAIQHSVVPSPDPRKDIVLAGAVSNVRSNDDFDIMGQPVKIVGSTHFDFAGKTFTVRMDQVTQLPGYFLTVFGSLDPSGYVVADFILPQQGGTVLVTGPITVIDRQTRTVDVMGIPVHLSSAYSYLVREGLTVNFDELKSGDQLRVVGSLLDTGVVDALIAFQSAPSAAVSVNGLGWGRSQRPILVGPGGIQADTTNAQFVGAPDNIVSCGFSPCSADFFWNHPGFHIWDVRVTQVDGTWAGDHIDATTVYLAWSD